METDQLKNQSELFEAYQKTFSSPHGKKVLEDLSIHCKIITTTLGNDPYETYLNEGKRAIGMHILSMLNMDLVRFQQLIKSHSEGVNGDQI